MAGYNEWDDDLDGDDRGSENPINALRKIERQQKAQIKELTEQLEAMSAQVRERSVRDVLASKGLNEKIAKFIPKEMTSTEDIDNWVTENGELFGAAPAAPASAPNGGAEATDPNFEALQRIAGAQSSGATMTGDASQMSALINSAQTPEELNRLLFGNGSGPSVV